MSAVDVVIPSHEKDFATLRHTVRSVLRHVEPVGRVLVVSNTEFDHPDGRVLWIPEPESPALPTITEVSDRWARDAPAATASRGSWIYQQLLKLGAPRYVPDLSGSYLVVDSDLVFLRPVSFDPDQLGRFPWSYGFEHHAPYADAFERLFGEPPPIFSLTAHHMLYDGALLEEMFAEMEARHDEPWPWAYMDAADRHEASAISEMDIYGPWVALRHPELARRRQLQWRDVRVVPGALARAMYAPDYDFVAAHAWFRVPRGRRLASYPARVAAELWASIGRRWTSS